MRARIIFIILKKNYENETKTNNTTIVSPLILHIIADGIKNNVEYFIVCTASYTLCKQKNTSAIHIIPTLEKNRDFRPISQNFGLLAAVHTDTAQHIAQPQPPSAPGSHFVGT